MPFSSWGIIEDSHMPELGGYAISPWFGLLINIDTKNGNPPRWLGFTKRSFTAFPAHLKHRILETFMANDISNPKILRIRRIKRLVNLLVAILPLWMLIFLLRNMPNLKLNQDYVLQDIQVALGINTNNTCLVDSLVRFYILRRRGDVTLNLGVLIPTTLMHAWIEINSEALHECPDRLVHFSKCVSYDA